MHKSLRLLATLRPNPTTRVLFGNSQTDLLPKKVDTSNAIHSSSSDSASRATTVHPHSPARTRFAPSPTGLLHLGSLRTALYNYLLARQTKGQFIIRMEDTDQKRVVPGAEKNVYDSLRWAGIHADESPELGGPHAPYRQSERGHIYKKYVDWLLSKNLAYKCYCPKERLVSLRESAQKLTPPTTVTYDRKCLHDTSSKTREDSLEYVVRFRSPEKYDKVEDLRHGILDLQPQYNLNDRRYDDFIIMKSDGLPTYHLANVVDDHLMGITHVIRGEEWLSSTPKHVALYNAFGWSPPKFVHIPLLTSLLDKKLSKRQGDSGISSFTEKGVLPQALVNFVALLGWAPPRPEKGKKVTEILSMEEMIEKFRLDNMTKGNVKVAEHKLWYFNKHYLASKLADPVLAEPLIKKEFEQFKQTTNSEFDLSYFTECVRLASGHLEKMSDLLEVHPYFFRDVEFDKVNVPKTPHLYANLRKILEMSLLKGAIVSVDEIQKQLPSMPSASIMQSLRFALTGMVPGVNIMGVSKAIGFEKYLHRLNSAIQFLEYSERSVAQ